MNAPAVLSMGASRASRAARHIFLAAGLAACGSEPGPGAPDAAQPADRPDTLVVLGHVGHGMSTLVSAIARLASQDGDGEFVPAEKLARPAQTQLGGHPVAFSAVGLRTPTADYALVGFPSYSDAIKGLLTGRLVPAGAVLVVSAAEGVMPQTRSQVLLASQLGVPRIVVFLNRMDLLQDAARLAAVEREVRALLTEYGYPGREVPVIRGSALKAVEAGADGEWQRGIEDLVAAIESYIPPVEDPIDAPELVPHAKFRAELYVKTAKDGGRSGFVISGYRPEFRFGTEAVEGRITLPEDAGMMLPGDNLQVLVELDAPAEMAKGTAFTISEEDRGIGFGIVTELVQ